MKIHDETYAMLLGYKAKMRKQTAPRTPSFDDVIMFLANKKQRRLNGRMPKQGRIQDGFWKY